MRVRCPGCDREYDATHFRFGRTIHCTCGHRVGPDRRIGPTPPEGEPRFLADAMLGRLARWLRTLGYDTAYEEVISDSTLVRSALAEDRYILTRDRRIPEEWQIDGCLVLDDDDTMDQLSKVVSEFELPRPERLFTRCRICNVELERVEAGEVADHVPAGVLERQERFSRCPGCDRIYWEGSHAERMRSVIDRIFEEASAPSDPSRGPAS